MDDMVTTTGFSRRMSTRSRKMARKMAAALASSDNRTQALLSRLDALENDGTPVELVEINDDGDTSLEEDDNVYTHKKVLKGTKRKTRQAKAFENTRRAPKTFMELLHDAELELLPRHVPSYIKAAVGAPRSSSRRQFCTVCGFSSRYTCVKCGIPFCSIPCQTVHHDTRCLKFVS